MKVFYSRCSTIDQNDERQLQNLEGFDFIFSDKFSGSIPLWERPKGSQIKRLVDDGKLSHLEVHSIDRLGRNTLDVLTVWEDLTKRKITIVCRNPSIRNIDENGKVDAFSALLLSITSTMAQYEKSEILKRQAFGINLRKAKGLYSGRIVGTSESKDKFLKKERSRRILEYLGKGHYSYEEISKIVGCSTTTVTKVRKLSQMGEPQ